MLTEQAGLEPKTFLFRIMSLLLKFCAALNLVELIFCSNDLAIISTFCYDLAIEFKRPWAKDNFLSGCS